MAGIRSGNFWRHQHGWRPSLAACAMVAVELRSWPMSLDVATGDVVKKQDYNGTFWDPSQKTQSRVSKMQIYQTQNISSVWNCSDTFWYLAMFWKLEVKFRRNASRRWCIHSSVQRGHHRRNCNWPSTPRCILPEKNSRKAVESSPEKWWGVACTSLNSWRCEVVLHLRDKFSQNHNGWWWLMAISNAALNLQSLENGQFGLRWWWITILAQCHMSYFVWGCNWQRPTSILWLLRCSPLWRIKLPRSKRGLLTAVVAGSNKEPRWTKQLIRGSSNLANSNYLQQE